MLYHIGKMTNFQTKLLLTSLLQVSLLPTGFTYASVPPYAVNMKNGGFLMKEMDEIKTGSGFDWKIERWYRSRSLYRGFFGQGWCSSLDEKLTLKSKGEIELFTCESPHPVIYKLNAQASSYVARNNKDDQIKISFGTYTRTVKNRKQSKFSFKGELQALYKNNEEIQLKWNSRKLIETLTFPKGERLQIKWHPILNQIEKISSPAQTLYYKYEGFLLLQKNQTRYQYDDLDNLLERKQGLDTLKIDYNKVEDSVVKIQSECTELYLYQAQKSQMRILCPHKPQQSKVFQKTQVAELQN